MQFLFGLARNKRQVLFIKNKEERKQNHDKNHGEGLCFCSLLLVRAVLPPPGTEHWHPPGSGLCSQTQQSQLLSELSLKILLLFFFLFMIAQIEHLPGLVSVMSAF